MRAADPSSAEVAVSVAELWQGRGLAKLMLTKLECRAVAAGVRRLFSETFATNEKALSLALKAGFVIAESGSQGAMRLEKTLKPKDYKRCRTAFEAVTDDGVGRS